ncbi:hypothetical protein L1049_016489 [Liquidambar formosana]|uniref:Uncharacterized protein n=1 Tax=Liquidambar formosana TaxID=63359 RepID=A0AAP0S0W8_LIQFO
MWIFSFRGTTSFTRRSCQTVLAAHLLSIVRAVAPILPHLAEDVWQNLPFQYTIEDSSIAEFVFESRWPALNKKWLAFPIEEIDFWGKLLEVITLFLTNDKSCPEREKEREKEMNFEGEREIAYLIREERRREREREATGVWEKAAKEEGKNVGVGYSKGCSPAPLLPFRSPLPFQIYFHTFLTKKNKESVHVSGVLFTYSTAVPKPLRLIIERKMLFEAIVSSSQMKRLKHRIDALDKEKMTYSYSLIEGDDLMDKIESISYEIKFEASHAGGCIVKNVSKYHPKPGVVINEEEVKASKEKAMGVYKAVEAYLLANPDAYA